MTNSTVPAVDKQDQNLAVGEQVVKLPTISDRPSADVVIYDGNCQFCQAQVARLRGFDRGARLAFLSLHDPIVAQQYPDLSHEQLMQQLYVVDRSGRRLGGASAFRYLSRRLPTLWILAPMLHIPFSLPLWQWGYRQIAARRYRLNRQDEEGCDDSSCAVHFRK